MDGRLIRPDVEIFLAFEGKVFLMVAPWPGGAMVSAVPTRAVPLSALTGTIVRGYKPRREVLAESAWKKRN